MSTNHLLKKEKRGATLLIAVLMVSVVLAVGFGIYQRTYKSLVFSSFLKQSQIAFNAADSGLECAMYLDLHFSDTVTELSCFDIQTIQKDSWVTDPGYEELGLITPSGGCVSIAIKKPSDNTYTYTETDPDTGAASSQTAQYSTHIEARGYNDCNNSNPRRVERGLYIDY